MTFAAAADAIIAQWEAEAPAKAAEIAARAADRRSVYLKTLIDSLRKPITEHGYVGFMQVMDNATSARGARLNRARRLYIGRQHQMRGYHSATRIALLDASVWRIAEKSRAETEAMRAEFDRIERIA